MQAGLTKRVMSIEAIANLTQIETAKKRGSCKKGKVKSSTFLFLCMENKLSHSFSGALRTFAYFMASGTHYMLNGVDYISLYGEEPSAIEQAFAIYANVIVLDEDGNVLNAKYAEKRATDYIRRYCDPNYTVLPEYEDWEVTLWQPPPLHDLI